MQPGQPLSSQMMGWECSTDGVRHGHKPSSYCEAQYSWKSLGLQVAGDEQERSCHALRGSSVRFPTCRARLPLSPVSLLSRLPFLL